MPNIHPSSIVEPGAELADDVVVGPFCHVGPKVKIGPGCHLRSHVVLCGRTTLGSHNTIWPHTVIGGDPQDLKFQGEDSEVVIGDHNDIREMVTINKGTAISGGTTRIGSHNLLMAYVHIGHDSIVGDHNILSNCVQLAGHVKIENNANIGGTSAVHHFVTIGSYAFVAGRARIVHDVPPYMVVEGEPARPRKVNTILLKRHHFPQEQIDRLKDAFRTLYGNAEDGEFAGNMRDNLAALDTAYPNDEHVQELVEAVRRSCSGVYGRYLEGLRHDNRFSNPVR